MKGNTYINDQLKQFFNGTAISGLTTNDASGTTLYLSLHTADPGAAGSQTTNEAAYGSYARVGAARTSGGFTVTGQSVTLAANATFPTCTSGSETEMFFGVGTASTGAGKLMYSGPIGQGKGAATALASTDVITAPAYTPTTGDRVSIQPVGSNPLPTGLTAGTVYFVVSPSGTTFKLSTTSGGSAIDITADGECYVFLHTPISVTAAPAVTPQLTTGTTITEQ